MLFTTPLKQLRWWNSLHRHVRLDPKPISVPDHSLVLFYPFAKSRSEPPFRIRNSFIDSASKHTAKSCGITIPYTLNASTSFEVKSGDGEIRDVFGRTLSKFPALKFRTGHRKPSLVVSRHHVVLQKGPTPRLFDRVANLKGLDIQVGSQSASDGSHNEQTKYVALDMPIDQATTKIVAMEDWLATESK